jgi:hypothetical protein
MFTEGVPSPRLDLEPDARAEVPSQIVPRSHYTISLYFRQQEAQKKVVRGACRNAEMTGDTVESNPACFAFTMTPTVPVNGSL